MVFSQDGGLTWNNDAELDNMMTGGGVFKYRNQAGPTNFTGFLGYPQPSLVAFDSEDPNIIVAGESIQAYSSPRTTARVGTC